MTEVRVTAAMSEADLQHAVLALARWLGVLAYHTHDSRRSQPGFPDLVLVGPRGVLYRELKTAKGRLSASQQAWATALGTAGADWGLWRPADLRDGRVKAQLQAIR